jgi:hypothetical protein
MVDAMTPPPPPGWPAGRPLAISVSVMLEGWAEGSAAPQQLPRRGNNPLPLRRFFGMSKSMTGGNS